MRARGVRTPDGLAKKVVGAAERQHTPVPGQAVIAQPVRTLSEEVQALNDKVTEVVRLIEA